MALVAGAFLSGCVDLRAPVIPPHGLIFTHYKAPLNTDLNSARLGTKRGTSQAYYLYVPYVYLDFAWDRADIRSALEEAKRSGGITRLSHADYEYLSVLWIFAQFKVEAYGE